MPSTGKSLILNTCDDVTLVTLTHRTPIHVIARMHMRESFPTNLIFCVYNVTSHLYYYYFFKKSIYNSGLAAYLTCDKMCDACRRFGGSVYKYGLTPPCGHAITLTRHTAAMEVTRMKIDKDGHYKTVDGRKVSVNIERDEIRGTVVGESGRGLIYTLLGQRYNKDGSVFDMVKGEELDAIVAEWTDTPEVGTLQEIGAQDGDTVEMVESDSGDYVGDVGIFQDRIVRCIDGSGCHKSYEDERCGHRWRIISRAQPKTEQTGPVRTVTRTTQEIVPGVYGFLWVSPVQGSNNQVTVGMRNSGDDTMQQVDAAELTVAIDTLIAIRDALKENG